MNELQRVAPEIVALALTYLVHSTIVLGIVWAISRYVRNTVTLERMWKWALILPVVTATTQFAYGAGMAFDLPDLTRTGEVLAQLEQRSDEETLAQTPVIVPSVGLRSAPAELSTAESPKAITAEPDDTANRIAINPLEPRTHTAATKRRPRLSTIGVILLLLAMVSGLLSLRIGIAWLMTLRWLRRETTRETGTLHGEVASLATKNQITHKINVRRSPEGEPAALGVLRWTIILPNACLADLSKKDRTALIAHELAHLVRRDPAWLWIGHAACSLLWFQPLNWVAVSKIRGLGEIRSDDWAVAHGVGRLQLARCLAIVAGWRHAGRPRSVAVAASGTRGGKPRISDRIERLVESSEKPIAGWTRLAATAMVCTTVASFALLPRVALGLDPDGIVAETSPVIDTEPLEHSASSKSLEEELQALVADLEHVERLLKNDIDPRLHAVARSLTQRLDELRSAISNHGLETHPNKRTRR